MDVDAIADAGEVGQVDGVGPAEVDFQLSIDDIETREVDIGFSG